MNKRLLMGFILITIVCGSMGCSSEPVLCQYCTKDYYFGGELVPAGTEFCDVEYSFEAGKRNVVCDAYGGVTFAYYVKE